MFNVKFNIQNVSGEFEFVDFFLFFFEYKNKCKIKNCYQDHN